MSVILEYKNVNKSFGDKQVLKDVNLKIESNKIVGLLGKNGSGKSTMFKLANDLLTLTRAKLLLTGVAQDYPLEAMTESFFLSKLALI